MLLRRSLAPALLGALLASAPPGRAQLLPSRIEAACVGGVIGCAQVDFFLTLTGPADAVMLDALRLRLVHGAGPWRFADPNISEAEDALGLTLVDPTVRGSSLLASFPLGALVAPTLRLRVEFEASDASAATLGLTYAGTADGDVVARGRLGAPSGIVPEPASVVLLATALAGLAGVAGVAGVAGAARRTRRAR